MALVTCKECNNRISDTADKCPLCGAKNKKKTSLFTWILGGLFAFIVWGGITESKIAAHHAKNNSTTHAYAAEPEYQTQVVQPEEVITTTAVEMSREYENNEARADSIYKDKLIQISGKVSSITKDFSDNTVVQLSGIDDFHDVHAGLNESEETKAINLQKGQKITLRCKSKGEVIASAMLDNCLFFDPSQAATSTKKTEFQKLLQRAESGEAEAQNKLGTLYYNGQGIAKDLKKAFEWYKKAALQGLSNAQYNLGAMYFDGEGTPQDKTKALEWLEKAAAQGVTESKYYLDQLHSK